VPGKTPLRRKPRRTVTEKLDFLACEERGSFVEEVQKQLAIVDEDAQNQQVNCFQ
jgi:hypothetical protein